MFVALPYTNSAILPITGDLNPGSMIKPTPCAPIHREACESHVFTRPLQGALAGPSRRLLRRAAVPSALPDAGPHPLAAALPLRNKRVMLTGARSACGSHIPATHGHGACRVTALLTAQGCCAPGPAQPAPFRNPPAPFRNPPRPAAARAAPRQYAGRLASLLIAAGASPVWLPGIEITRLPGGQCGEVRAAARSGAAARGGPCAWPRRAWRAGRTAQCAWRMAHGRAGAHKGAAR